MKIKRLHTFEPVVRTGAPSPQDAALQEILDALRPRGVRVRTRSDDRVA